MIFNQKTASSLLAVFIVIFVEHLSSYAVTQLQISTFLISRLVLSTVANAVPIRDAATLTLTRIRVFFFIIYTSLIW